MVNDPACSLSESSAEDELELDLFDTASQVGDSLPRLDIGCGVKKFRKSMDMVPLSRSLYTWRAERRGPSRACKLPNERRASSNSQCMHPWSVGNGNGRQL